MDSSEGGGGEENATRVSGERSDGSGSLNSAGSDGQKSVWSGYGVHAKSGTLGSGKAQENWLSQGHQAFSENCHGNFKLASAYSQTAPRQDTGAQYQVLFQQRADWQANAKTPNANFAIKHGVKGTQHAQGRGSG